MIKDTYHCQYSRMIHRFSEKSNTLQFSSGICLRAEKTEVQVLSKTFFIRNFCFFLHGKTHIGLDLAKASVRRSMKQTVASMHRNKGQNVIC